MAYQEESGCGMAIAMLLYIALYGAGIALFWWGLFEVIEWLGN